MGRKILTTLALTDADEIAGYPQLSISETDIVFQDDTLGVAAHRGHRLGTAIKRTNLIELMTGFPHVDSVRTWNAEENKAMRAINDELDFVPVENVAELIKKTDASSTSGISQLCE